MEKDISTEKKIKDAARKIFLEKGYGQSRTRDIAEEAGINLALLNYYFRSKEKLFDIIMEESMQNIFTMLAGVINDRHTTLSEKLDIIVARYIDNLLDNPNLPLFVLSEIQANPQRLIKKIGIPKNIIASSCFYEQINEQIKINGLQLTPIHIFINIVSMSIFPIVAKPLLTNLHYMDALEYRNFINDRRKLIPQWIKEILKIKE